MNEEEEFVEHSKHSKTREEEEEETLYIFIIRKSTYYNVIQTNPTLSNFLFFSKSLCKRVLPP